VKVDDGGAKRTDNALKAKGCFVLAIVVM